ncbi:MAG: hypothetical protein QW532_02525 [Archaeoglobaceae archaeon]
MVRLNFLLILLLLSTVQAVELEIRESGNAMEVCLKKVPEPGVGSFSFELLIEGQLDSVEVYSENFMVVSNLEGNRILVAGIQGNVPGPSGEVSIFKVKIPERSRLKILKAIVSDVNGNVIMKTSQEGSDTQRAEVITTPQSNGTESPTSTTPDIRNKATHEVTVTTSPVLTTTTQLINKTFPQITPESSINDYNFSEEPIKIEETVETPESKRSNVKGLPGFEIYLAGLAVGLILMFRRWMGK